MPIGTRVELRLSIAITGYGWFVVEDMMLIVWPCDHLGVLVIACLPGLGEDHVFILGWVKPKTF